MDILEELGYSDISVNKFLDTLRDIKGYTSIIATFTDESIADHNRTFFYDGYILEYQVGTNRIVKAVVDGDSFMVRKDGVEYKGEKARALFRNDRDFKDWKKTCDGEKNALIRDACARLELYNINYVYALKELQLPKEYTFCTIQELMAFIMSREFETVQARYLPPKDSK